MIGVMEDAMTLAQTLPARRPSTIRLSFILKVVLTGGLAFLADTVFSSGSDLLEAGSAAGLLAGAWLAALLSCDPLMRHNRASHLALAGAALAALALILEPGLIAALLFLLYLGLALFLPRYGAFDNALRWACRLMLHAVLSPLTILFDAMRLGAAGHGRKHAGFLTLAGTFLLMLSGSLIFLLLFSYANPLIDNGLSQLAALLTSADLMAMLERHLVFLLGCAVLLWASFRPLRMRLLDRRAALIGPRPLPRTWFGANSIIAALAAFNLVFAVQNLSDIAFLWGGATLPDGVTLSGYAHRGTDALIVTALLAAIFVLVFLRTGSPLSANPTVRLLVYVWIGQTVLLVASSMLRTMDYIEAYSLTYLRIAALIFLALVAAGLFLISWRIAKGRDGAWLINANALCVVIVLGVCSFTNFDGIIASWNLAGAQGPQAGNGRLDTDYLQSLNSSGALVPLAQATSGSVHLGNGDDLVQLRRLIQARVEGQQADWRRWTVAAAWRLRTVGPLPPTAPSR